MLKSIRKPFRFLNFWTKHQSFKEEVKKIWEVSVKGSPFLVLNEKLKLLNKALLANWSKATYGNLFKKISTFGRYSKNKEMQLEINPSEENRTGLRREGRIENISENRRKISKTKGWNGLI